MKVQRFPYQRRRSRCASLVPRLQTWLVMLVPLMGLISTRLGWGDETPSSKTENAEVPATAINFASQIEPLIQQHCIKCHGDKEPEGGLRLTSRSEVTRRNDSGTFGVVPGKRAESELFRRITLGADNEERMPPEGEMLSVAEQSLIGDWIDAGAIWPEVVSEKHWAYIAPLSPAVPGVAELAKQNSGLFPLDATGNVAKVADWSRSPIDAFVLKQMGERGLAPSPRADPARLLRRLYLDVIGLPPSVTEVDAFLADSSEEHYARIVDELLASPRYGEKWARGWLDLARYADSNGFQADQFREMWAYRDWIIRAINEDKPFTDFTIEQIAGDLLPNASLDQKIATGFHRCTTCNVEAGVDPEENRVNQVIDRVNTTGIVWLGTTLECAQCHNHKYDPFSQQDYYQLFAFYNNTPLEVIGNGGVQFEVAGPQMPLPLSPEQQIQFDRLADKKQGLLDRQTELLAQLQSRLPKLIDEYRRANEGAAEWHVVPVSRLESTGGSTGTRLEDGSLLIGGKLSDKDEYTLHLETRLTGITGIRLETLADESLPGSGPGRGSEKMPNFVLYEFTLTASPLPGEEPREQAQELPPSTSDCVEEEQPPANNSTTPGDSESVSIDVELHTPRADFSQQRWDVAGLIDGDPTTGWAINPQFGKDHWATFLTKEPLGFEQGTALTIKLPQHYGGARTIGRLRISLMTGTPVETNGTDKTPGPIRKLILETMPPVDPSGLTSKQLQSLVDFFASRDPMLSQIAREIAAVDKSLKAIQPATTLVMVEMEQPRQSSIFKRGDFLTPLAEVQATVPAALHPLGASTLGLDLPESATTNNRLALAQWLVDRQNPLVARVVVNRWWGEFFGKGIVKTAEDFGTQGERPTHPELLDWLAVEFMEQGWSRKSLHRQILLSATYRQSATVSPRHLEVDPQNDWLARGPRVRMSAEAIRDNALAISGLLTHQLGGPPVYPPQPDNIWRHVGRNAPKYIADTDADRYRRGIYVVYRRSAPYPSFVNFDAPDRGACVVERSRSNTPLQALTLLNDPAYVEMAHALALRILTERPATLDTPNLETERLVHAFRTVLSRAPSERELEQLSAMKQRITSRIDANQIDLAKLIPPSSRVPDVPVQEQATWFYVANLLLNLDETITKN